MLARRNLKPRLASSANEGNQVCGFCLQAPARKLRQESPGEHAVIGALQPEPPTFTVQARPPSKGVFSRSGPKMWVCGSGGMGATNRWGGGVSGRRSHYDERARPDRNRSGAWFGGVVRHDRTTLRSRSLGKTIKPVIHKCGLHHPGGVDHQQPSRVKPQASVGQPASNNRKKLAYVLMSLAAARQRQHTAYL